MYGPATLADISLRIRFTCLCERRRTHHKAPSNPAAWRYCWFSVIAGKPGNAQTPRRLGSVRVSGHRRPASSSVLDKVVIGSGISGVSIDTNEYSPTFPTDDWEYLRRGIMVQ